MCILSGLLVSGAAALSPSEQAAIGDAVYRNFIDPILGDVPSVLSVVAWVSWVFAVILAAFALHRSGKPLVPCILLGMSAIFVSHASMLGPMGMMLFAIAAVLIERAESGAVTGDENLIMPLP